jgi:hypothetical protein
MLGGAGGEAWAPPPLPTPWASRQGNPGSCGFCPSSWRVTIISFSNHVEILWREESLRERNAASLS